MVQRGRASSGAERLTLKSHVGKPNSCFNRAANADEGINAKYFGRQWKTRFPF